MSSTKKTINRRMTLKDLHQKKKMGEKIVALTAYDYSFAKAIDNAGVDLILVGDSLAMVALGHNDTLSVTMEEMLHHCKAVSRGSSNSFLVGDMPFLSYQVDMSDAIRNAGRFLAEAGMNGVKLEGGSSIASTVKSIVRAGIPVMGHIGLMPQFVHQIGGYSVQGDKFAQANSILEDALALEEAGCFAIVLESIPQQLGEFITKQLDIPTIGIGSGMNCDGQILVTYDLLGLFDNFKPKFVKRYSDLSTVVGEAVRKYSSDVRESSFPDDDYSHNIPEDQWSIFVQHLKTNE